MATTREPLVMLDRDLRVVGASRAYFQMFPMQLLAGKTALFCEPRYPSLDNTILQLLKDAISSNTPIEGREIELDVPNLGRRTMLLNAQPMTDDEYTNTVMLAGLRDVTEIREAEALQAALLRQKETLLLEVHHRVANSLQIIASILVLKARTAQSEETKRYLKDVHHRLILVATVQRQLSTASTADEIEFGPYLRHLCDDLASSMISEETGVAIDASSTGGTIKSGDAISFGLIVTELVINALKHGFPEGRKGRIAVDFAASGADWRLSVSDNGIGRPPETGEQKRIGLGTSIVAALAQQLRARVEISANTPGAATAIIHTV